MITNAKAVKNLAGGDKETLLDGSGADYQSISQSSCSGFYPTSRFRS